MEHYIMLAAAVAYVSICLTVKDGPNDIFLKLRYWAKTKLEDRNNPFNCTYCMMFWVYILIFLPINPIFPELKYFFGTLGIAAFIRGGTQEYS